MTSELPYLLQLGERLSRGLMKMDDARRARHRAFIVSQQQPDGGFSGREGDSDLYYTSFAVRVALLDQRRLVDTNTEFKARFGLKTYYFSSAPARRRFEPAATR